MNERKDSILIKGAPGSPYTRKMLAVLRYKHIPYRYLNYAQADALHLPKPKVDLLPTFWFPKSDGGFEPMVDSTPLIRRLDAVWPNRAVLPADPALAFIDALIEDYADEWLTKAMFHYRWHHMADREKSGAILPLHLDVSAAQDRVQMMSQMFTSRQVGRLHYVGSNDVTAPVIEASYERFLEIMEAILSQRPFLFGARPLASDFAVFGQLTQLALFDPTPSDVTLHIAPRVYAWAGAAEDLSGVAGDAVLAPRETVQNVLGDLLSEIGRVYVPVLLANERAIKAGSQEAETEVDGRPWRQNTFPYHLKCLEALRAAYAGLSSSDMPDVKGWLEGTGVDALFES